jgi:hypothetical protein
MAKSYNVRCDYVSGLQLRLFDVKTVDKDDAPRAIATGEVINLKSGFNPGVDGPLWERWVEQHKESPLTMLLHAEEEK